MPDTKRIAQALQCIRDHLAQRGRAPSVRELASCMGFASPRSASLVIDDLVQGGYVTKRSDGRLQLLREFHGGGMTTVAIPIVGVAPCGSPVEAEENIEGFVRVSTELAKPPHHYFILHAKGNSMDRAGIDDGDLVLVRSASIANDGERVVALVDGESTIKVLRHEGEVAVLEPASTDQRHRPIYANSELLVQGVVVNSFQRNKTK